MGFLDIKTLSFVALVTSLLLPLVVATSAQFTSTRTPGSRSLMNGSLVYATGFLLLALRGNVPDWLSFFIGNVLIVGGFAELAIGLQIYLRGQMNRRWMMLLTVGNAVGMYWFVVVTPDPSQRVFISSIFLLPICILLAGEFLVATRQAAASNERGATAEKRLLLALAVVFMLSALSFAWRANNFWNVRGDINPATTGGQTWGLSFMVGVLLNILLATCMPLLISRRNQRALSQSQSLLQETERLADVGSFLYEPATGRISPNGVMSAWLNLSIAPHAGLARFLDRLDPDQARELRSHMDAIASGEQTTWEGQCHMAVPGDGNGRWLSVHCGGGKDAAGQAYVIVSARNITEFRAATQAAIEARNEADRANAAKSAFLANMSHEIRTPMNGVLGLTRLCLQGKLAPRERELIEKCHAAAQTLLGVVNDILDFSKIEAGKMVLENAPFDLAHTIDNARNLVEQMAGSKGLRFVVDLDPELPPVLLGDSLRLSQILNNLLSNAVKFTDSGEVRLCIRGTQASPDATQLTFAVSDTGIGMSAQQVQGLFRAFAQADVSTTRKYGGTGLGLVISQRLASLMGGVLSVHSVEGQGSTFTAELPFGISNAQPTTRQATVSSRSGKRLQGLRILLVEDNPTNVLVATLSLESEGAKVTHCADGQQAVDHLRTHPDSVDVVLMDIQMPVMDGYTATRHIREQLGMTTLPIVAMTANVMESDREASGLAGMRAHVGKPFDMERLVAVLLEVTGHAPPPASAGETLAADPSVSAPPRSPADSPEQSVALESALQRMGNDAALMCMAAESFATGLDEMFATLRERQADLKHVQTTLHTLKGLTATLGLNAAAAQTRELEALVKQGECPQPARFEALEQLVTNSLHELMAQLQVLVPPTVAPAVGVGTPAEAQRAMQELAGLLAQSDLSALECFAQHRDLFQSQYPDAFEAVETALHALDFQAAQTQCHLALQTVK